MSYNTKKILLVLFIVIVSVVPDQLSKQWASARLATQRSDFSQTFTVVVPDKFDGKTLTEYLTAELTGTQEGEITLIGSRFAFTENKRLKPNSIVTKGQKIEIYRRTVTVIDGLCDFRYARNTGAAWSFLAEADSSFRRPFLISVTGLAILLVFFLLWKLDRDQHILLVLGLASIVGGAIGNLIDRVQLDYVIDFIHCYYNDLHWPTFNIADISITVGAVLVMYVMFFKMKKEEEEEENSKEEQESPKEDKGSQKASSGQTSAEVE